MVQAEGAKLGASATDRTKRKLDVGIPMFFADMSPGVFRAAWQTSAVSPQVSRN